MTHHVYSTFVLLGLSFAFASVSLGVISALTILFGTYAGNVALLVSLSIPAILPVVLR